MAAYAAVLTLKHTLHHLLQSNSKFSVAISSREIVEFAIEELTSAQQVLGRSDGRRFSRKALEPLDAAIRDAVCILEDAIESRIYNQILSSLPEKELIFCSTEMSPLIAEVKKMEEQYIYELDNPSPEEEEEDEVDVSSSVDFEGRTLNIFGLEADAVIGIKKELTRRKSYEFNVVSIIAMDSTEATLVAKAAFERRRAEYFEVSAWATVGPGYQLKHIIATLLSQIDPGDDYKHLSELGNDENLAEQLHTSLKGRKYLIVLDNVCDTKVWDYLGRSFPVEFSGSRVLITTNQDDVAGVANKIHPLCVLNNEESWSLFREAVFGIYQPLSFGTLVFPPEFEEVGRTIAQNCLGLRHEIIKFGFLFVETQLGKIEIDKQRCLSEEAYQETLQKLQTAHYWQADDLLLDHGDGVHEEIRNDLCDFGSWQVPQRSQNTEHLQVDALPNAFPLPRVFSLWGMAGIGKTTIAKEIFEDSSISNHFDHRVWLTLGPKYRYERTLIDILAQLDHKFNKMHMIRDESLFEQFTTILSGKKCLIVLDDVWDREPLRYLIILYAHVRFEVLLTTRHEEVGEFIGFESRTISLLSEEQSWRLFCGKVFGEKSCPTHLEKPGKRIVEKCGGLPLMIVTIASLLSQEEKTPEFWNKVARSKKNEVFEQAYEKIWSILLPSYEFLPQHLKPCFLYMAAIPLECVPTTSLIRKLWNSEGIIESDASEILKQLFSKSLVLASQNYPFKIKHFELHSVFWHFCVRKAREIKFFHVLNSKVDGTTEAINGQRRMCIHNNVLFAIKDVHTAIASNSTIRALLCTGQYHRYPVPICFTFILLRVLEAASIHFYEFPFEAFELVQLRYLSLSYYGKLPASISRLVNLQYLIVRGHLNRELLYGAPLYLPMQIWDMEQLKHLEVVGSDLPDPCGAVLPNLLTLLHVSPRSCTQAVFEGTPNLEKLGIRINLFPDASESSFCFDHISHLPRLRSLKCVIMNPEFQQDVVPPSPVSTFASSCLTKLSLCGQGYPWEYMSIIGKLQNLLELKLRCYAFRGPKWEMQKGEFTKLKYLLIEDTDLVSWRAGDGCFLGTLFKIIIKRCYKLVEMPSKICGFLHAYDCNPSLFVGDKPLFIRYTSWE